MHGIELFALPSHTSQFLQPLDSTVFKMFKSHFDKAITSFSDEHNHHPTWHNMAAVGSVALAQSLTYDYICSGF